MRVLLALLAAGAAAGISLPAARNTTAGPPRAYYADSKTPIPIAKDVLAVVFKLLKIDADAQACVNDVSGSGHELRNFADDFKAKNYSLAIRSLGRGISSMASSVKDCGVEQFKTKIDALAAAIRWANVSTKGFDDVVEIIVGAADLEKDVEGLATAIESGDPDQIGNAIGALLNDWTAVVGGCGSSDVCKFMDGILRIVQAVAEDVTPCENAIEPALKNFSYGADLWEQKNMKGAVASFAKGLDILAQALDQDSCGLKNLADVLKTVAPRLEAAIVKEVATGYQIMVRYADVYDEIYQAVMAIKNGDMDQLGLELGRLLQALRASGCQSDACIALQGLLGIFQLEASDFDQCAADADKAWVDIQLSMKRFEDGSLGQAVGYLAQGVVQLANAVKGCDVPEIGTILENTATKLGGDAVSAEIGKVVSILVNGADVTDDLAKAAQDFSAKSWQAFGNDLGTLSDFMQSTQCKSIVCNIVEGLLQASSIAFKDLQTCEKDLYAARNAFISGAQYFGKKQVGAAVKEWAEGLNEVAKAVSGCGITDELKFIEQEANVFGFANTSIIGDVTQVLVHGTDFYEDLYAVIQAFEDHDYRSVGQELGKVLNELSEWTSGHACTSNVCYVVIGVVQFLGDIEGSFKECETDLKGAWTDFTQGFKAFQSSHESIIFHWKHDKDEIKAGLKDIGAGFTSVSKSVGDCHMQEFADLLEKLAVKLGVAPEISWIEELLHILIEGVEIEKEIGAACTDYAEDNWVGFGWNLAKLIKTLL